MDELKADINSMLQFCDNDSVIAAEILTDIFNGDYTIESFKNDVIAAFEPDDRGDINR